MYLVQISVTKLWLGTSIIKYSDNWSCWAATIKKQRYVAISQQHRQDSEGAKY